VEILDHLYGDGVEIEFEVYFIELRDGKIRSDEAVKYSSTIHHRFIADSLAPVPIDRIVERSEAGKHPEAEGGTHTQKRSRRAW
jgi:hypothetical protein